MINGNYQKFLSAYFLSSIGDWLYKLALPIFLYQKTGSAFVMAVTYGLTFLPFVLVTPFGGVIADRLSRKQMLIRGDAASFILTLLLGILVFIHIPQLWILYALVFLISAVNSLYHPVFQSIIPELVDKENLPKANSFISSSENMILLLGPASSGLVIALLGPTLAIFVNSVSFLVSALLMKSIHCAAVTLNRQNISIKSIFNDLRDGLVFSYKNPIIKFGCLLFIFANFGVQIILANLMFYLTNNLKLTPTFVGLTFTLIGVGAILGSLLAPVLGRRISEGRLILLACMGEGISASLLLFFKNWVGVGIAWGLVSGCISVVVVTYFTLRQKIIPNHYLGRVVAITRLISYCAIPVASIFGGWLLKNHYAFSDLALIGAIVMIFNGLLGWFTPLNQKDVSSQAQVVEKI